MFSGRIEIMNETALVHCYTFKDNSREFVGSANLRSVPNEGNIVFFEQEGINRYYKVKEVVLYPIAKNLVFEALLLVEEANVDWMKDF